MRGAEHRLLDRHAGEVRADLHRAARLDVAGLRQHALVGAAQQPPGLQCENASESGVRRVVTAVSTACAMAS